MDTNLSKSALSDTSQEDKVEKVNVAFEIDRLER
jgi:hypothetical protein